MTDDSQAWWTDGEPGPSTEVDPLAPIPPNFEPGEWWSPGPDAVQNVRGEVVEAYAPSISEVGPTYAAAATEVVPAYPSVVEGSSDMPAGKPPRRGPLSRLKLRLVPWRQVTAALALVVVCWTAAAITWSRAFAVDNELLAKLKDDPTLVEAPGSLDRPQAPVSEERIELPDVTKMSKAEATETMIEAGIAQNRLVFKEQPHVLAAGSVISQIPPGGTDDPTGSISLTLAAKAAMPTLTGKTEDDAVSGLSELGVQPVIERRFRFGQPAGVVVDQRPAGGADLVADATIVVSQDGVSIDPNELQTSENDCYSGTILVGAAQASATYVCDAYPGSTEPDRTIFVAGGEMGSFETTVAGSADGPPGMSVEVLFIADGAILARVDASAGSSTPVAVDLTGRQRFEIQLGLVPANPNQSDTLEVGLMEAKFTTSPEVAERLAND